VNTRRRMSGANCDRVSRISDYRWWTAQPSRLRVRRNLGTSLCSVMLAGQDTTRASGRDAAFVAFCMLTICRKPFGVDLVIAPNQNYGLPASMPQAKSLS
jgi:hypothetical protein